MSSIPQIIFRNITNLNDARYAATVFAHAVSFSAEPQNADYISPEKVSEIGQWLSGPKKLLEINNPNLNEVLEFISKSGVDGIITSNIELYEQISMRGLEVIWDASQIKKDTLWPQIIYSKIDPLPQNYFLHLSEPDQVSAVAILSSDVKGISIFGTEESELGMKDYTGWNEFFDQLLEG